MRWLGSQAAGRISRRLGRNLYKADEAILEKAREMIGVHGPPASSPGDPPHVESSRLIDSLYGEVDEAGLGSRIGSTEEHAYYMEIGAPNAGVAARPWLEPACVMAADDAARELAR